MTRPMSETGFSVRRRGRRGAFEHELVAVFNLHGGRFSADHRRGELELLDRRLGGWREPRMRPGIEHLDRADRPLLVDHDRERDGAGDPRRLGVGRIDGRDEVRQDRRFDRAARRRLARPAAGGRRLGGGRAPRRPAVRRRPHRRRDTCACNRVRTRAAGREPIVDRTMDYRAGRRDAKDLRAHGRYAGPGDFPFPEPGPAV